MIHEVEASQLVTYLAKKSGRESFTCTYSYLRKIGDYIEQQDQTIHVELGERSIRAFRSRSVRHILISENRIQIEETGSPVIQSLFRQYSPDNHVVELIDQALKSFK